MAARPYPRRCCHALRKGLRRCVGEAETVYVLLEVIGLTVALLAAGAEFWQWLKTEDAFPSAASAETTTHPPSRWKFLASLLHHGAASRASTVAVSWATWYWLWLVAIATDALGLAVLIVVTVMHSHGGHWLEVTEFNAMLVLLFSSAVEVVGSMLYQPLEWESVGSWPQMLLFTTRHSWLLSCLIDFAGLALLVAGYYPRFSEAMLGLDVWGLLLIAISALLEVKVVNPHCGGLESPKLSGHTWDEYDWHSTWAQENDYWDNGWEASAYLEAAGMLMLIAAEVFEHAVMHGHNMRETLLAAVCCYAPRGAYLQVDDETEEPSDTHEDDGLTGRPPTPLGVTRLGRRVTRVSLGVPMQELSAIDEDACQDG